MKLSFRNLWRAVLVMGVFLGVFLRRAHRLSERLRTLANTDMLTGCHSRRHFFELAEQALADAHRKRRPLAVAMLDMDHFKRVNDTHGHDAGDALLKQLVATCQASLRSSDVLGRLGGEEFAALLPETDLETAREVAERLRQAVAATTLDWNDTTLRPTVSVGVAALVPEMDLDHLLQAADAALYQAKGAGRNRIAVA